MLLQFIGGRSISLEFHFFPEISTNSKILRMLEDASLLCNDKFFNFKKLDFNLKLWKFLKQSAKECLENWHAILSKKFLCYDSKIRKWKISGILHITDNGCLYISQTSFSHLSNVLVVWKRPQPVRWKNHVMKYN